MGPVTAEDRRGADGRRGARHSDQLQARSMLALLVVAVTLSSTLASLRKITLKKGP
jgi:hypothetical protein